MLEEIELLGKKVSKLINELHEFLTEMRALYA